MFTSEQTKNAVLFDASLAYRFNNGLEISITARNLLNQQTYAYSVYSGLEEFSCEYRIRPLNILIGDQRIIPVGGASVTHKVRIFAPCKQRTSFGRYCPRS